MSGKTLRHYNAGPFIRNLGKPLASRKRKDDDFLIPFRLAQPRSRWYLVASGNSDVQTKILGTMKYSPFFPALVAVIAVGITVAACLVRLKLCHAFFGQKRPKQKSLWKNIGCGLIALAGGSLAQVYAPSSLGLLGESLVYGAGLAITFVGAKWISAAASNGAVKSHRRRIDQQANLARNTAHLDQFAGNSRVSRNPHNSPVPSGRIPPGR